ncbi:MAG TPA: hypothetical protein VFR86_15600 [Burkholderiaceae bacterium]|nr:hypothetical protein [Burkholderiaceae bacterium]
MSKADRSYWLLEANTAVPAEAWAEYKRQCAGGQALTPNKTSGLTSLSTAEKKLAEAFFFTRSLATPPREALSTAQKLLAEAFTRPRDPRSNEYKAGVRAALEFRLAGVAIDIPYPLGTAQADAFFSGLQEGHAIWRAYLDGTEFYATHPIQAEES